MAPGAVSARLGVVLLLVALNAFFVAAEFALVAVRRSRIDEMADAGDQRRKNVQKALRTSIDTSPARSSASPSRRLLLDGLASRRWPRSSTASSDSSDCPPAPAGVHSGFALAFSFFILTFLHIVLGELAPKSLALVNPEGVSKLVTHTADVLLAVDVAADLAFQRCREFAF